jgi:hypothetical protein
LLILACRMACYYALCWIQLMVNLPILGRGEGAPPRFVSAHSIVFQFPGYTACTTYTSPDTKKPSNPRALVEVVAELHSPKSYAFHTPYL